MMNAYNLKNLEILSKNLVDVSRTNFDLSHFRSTPIGTHAALTFDEQTGLPINECGSLGCAIGWSPFIKGLEHNQTEINRCSKLDYLAYGIRLFSDLESVRISDWAYVPLSLWDFLFSEDLAYIDNTAQGCVNRINHFLDIGIDQMLENFVEFQNSEDYYMECIRKYVERYSLRG